MPTIIWKPVPGWGKYYLVSNTGQVRSLGRSVPVKYGNPHHVRSHKGYVLSPVISYGYRVVCLSANGRRLNIKVSRLVLSAFRGTRRFLFACHNDGNSLNDNIDNLRWDTQKGNTADSIKHGTFKRGTDHVNSKISLADLSDIREMLAMSVPYKIIAGKFGLCKKTVVNIKKGVRYKTQAA